MADEYSRITRRSIDAEAQVSAALAAAPAINTPFDNTALANQQSGMATVFVSRSGARIAGFYETVVQAVQAGQYTQAESARIEAYALLDSGIEQKLRGFAPDLALKVEAMFWQGDQQQPGLSVLIANNAKLADVKAGV